jgi:hypothetical protein
MAGSTSQAHEAPQLCIKEARGGERRREEARWAGYPVIVSII